MSVFTQQNIFPTALSVLMVGAIHRNVRVCCFLSVWNNWMSGSFYQCWECQLSVLVYFFLHLCSTSIYFHTISSHAREVRNKKLFREKCVCVCVCTCGCACVRFLLCLFASDFLWLLSWPCSCDKKISSVLNLKQNNNDTFFFVSFLHKGM